VELDAGEIALAVAPRAPRRTVSVYLILSALAFGLLWLRDIVPAMISGGTPASITGLEIPTNFVEVLDFAFSLPLMALAGVWLWRRHAWGYVLAGALVVMLAIESVSVTADQIFGRIAAPAQPLTAVPLFAVLSIVGAAMSIAYLRGTKRA
jgi:hypothetical protein